MRKAITLLLIGAFCITLLSPPISAMQWDPKKPPYLPYLQVGPDRPNGEEGGWNEPTDNYPIKPDHNTNSFQSFGLYSFVNIVFIKIIIINKQLLEHIILMC